MTRGGLVLHDASLERARNEVANANCRAQMARSGGFSSMPPPDPNSEFMRKIKAATVERAIQANEAHRRSDCNEEVRPYNRKADYYKLLGIDKEASAAEVRRAFRRLSLRYHPDKVAHKSDEEQAEAADMFSALKEAHEVLSHEATRRE
jgi:DnaJ-domain-containing protein 1